MLVERRLRSLAGAISQGVVIVDHYGTITFANRAVEPLLGRLASDSAGRALREFPLLAALCEPVEEALDQSDSQQEHRIVEHFGGTAITVFRDASGSIAGAVVVVARPPRPELAGESAG
jgi:PAS domain S-box-containing protein